MGAFFAPNALLYVIWALAFFGFLPYNDFSANANMFGTVIELSIFSFALSYQMHRLKVEKQRIEVELQESKALNGKDPMTGLWNRLYFDNEFHRFLKERQVQREPFAFMIADIDDFKQVNDLDGHPRGDEVIVAIAQLLERLFKRDCDRVFRLGGEEFGIILCSKNADEAIASAQRCVAAVEALAMVHPRAPKGVITISAGLALCETIHLDAFEIYTLADRQLYDAKTSGKNRLNYVIV